MNLLLDTHVFVWMDIAPANLSPSAVQAIQDPTNKVYLSLASVWEMQIKMQLGKLKLNADLKTTLKVHTKTNNLIRLPITLEQILDLDKLPYHHRDPFDRLLIAQARIKNLTLITDDANIQKYAVLWLW